MEKNLPVYQMDIIENDDSNVEVDFVALVDRPAIEKQFLAFKDNRMSFAITDEEQYIISGALMLADTPIYRNDLNGEYYVVFGKEVIKKIAQKYFRKGYQNNVNLMHDSGKVLDGLTMFESWITDDKRGVKAMAGFEDVADGSWFGSFKVDNPEVWKMIKDGMVKGFSVEGIFNYKRTETTSTQKMFDAIVEILNQVK